MTKKRDENIHKEDNKSEKRGEVVRIGEKEREMRENQTQRERERMKIEIEFFLFFIF